VHHDRDDWTRPAPQWDRRNLDFPVPKLTTARLWRFWTGGPVLDQGATPQCVGYAGWGWLRGGPVINKDLPFTPSDLYHWAQERDEWPGEDYEGTSTLGLMKALKDKGYISEYRWALDAETLVAWVLENGPVVVGTNWYMDMFTPDRWGFISPAGENVGGHEWRIVGASRTRQCPDGTTGAVRMINSWGTGWGQNGRAWVSITDLDRLIKEDGEAVTAPELKL
jgi:hypothetical protein